MTMRSSKHPQQQWSAQPPSVDCAVAEGAGTHQNTSRYHHADANQNGNLHQRKDVGNVNAYQQYNQLLPSLSAMIPQETQTTSWPFVNGAVLNANGHFVNINFAPVPPPPHQRHAMGAVTTQPPPAYSQLSGQKFFCALCKIACPNELALRQHYQGQKHRRQQHLVSANKEGLNPPSQFYCKLCNTSCTSESSLRQHMDGDRHRRKAALVDVDGAQALFVSHPEHLQQSTDPSVCHVASGMSRSSNGGRFHCQVCNITCTGEFPYYQHIAGKNHKKRAIALGIRGSAPAGEAAKQTTTSGPSHNPPIAGVQVKNQTELPSSRPLQPPTKIRPLARQPNADEDESEEEGEINEEKQDIDNLYDEFEAEPVSKTSSVNSTHGPLPEDEYKEAGEGRECRSDIDGIFATKSPATKASDDDLSPEKDESGSLSNGTSNEEDDLADMFGEDVSVDSQENNANFDEDTNENRSVKIEDEKGGSGSLRNHELQQRHGLVENDDIHLNQGREEEDNHVEQEGLESSGEVSSTNEINIPTHPVQQLVKVESRNLSPESEDPERNLTDMFGNELQDKVLEMDEVGHPREPAHHMHECINSKVDEGYDLQKEGAISSKKSDEQKMQLPEPKLLDSGLGFVLDYSPDTLIASKETDKPGSSQQIHLANMMSRATEPMQPSNDYDNTAAPPPLPAELHKNSGIALGSRIENVPAAKSQSQEEESDTIDMFGSDDEEEDAATSHIQDNTLANSPMTAARALAAARNRLTRQISNKRAKVSSQQLQHAKLPDEVPPTYYAPVHPDKYWSELRSWDFVRALNDANTHKKKETERKRPLNESAGKNNKEGDKEGITDSLPDIFESVAHYKSKWVPLLINEAKAQILSGVLSDQLSESTAWFSGTEITMGAAVTVELSRTARDHSSSNSLEPTVVIRMQPKIKGAGIGPVSPNDLLLFVHQPSTIERALRGEATSSCDASSWPSKTRPYGRLGFVGHAINHRTHSLDGLLARASQNWWRQFSSLDELFVIRIGSNVTGKSPMCLQTNNNTDTPSRKVLWCHIWGIATLSPFSHLCPLNSNCTSTKSTPRIYRFE